MAIFGDAATPTEAVSFSVFGDGDAVRMHAGGEGARLILAAGKPFNEAVARYGPFVMNTHEEIIQAVEDFRAGRL